MQFDRSLGLEVLIRHCADPKSPHRDRAWNEFLERYKMFMYKVVSKKCAAFNIERLKRQLSETVNDIVFDVIFKLNANDGKALLDFRAGEDEKKFLAYLAIICEHTTSRFIQKYLDAYLIEASPENLQKYLGGLKQDQRWMLYDDLVSTMRSQASQRERNVERDIHIFMLRKWAQLSKPMIMTNPCLQKLKEHTLDVVVNRISDRLRQVKKSEIS